MKNILIATCFYGPLLFGMGSQGRQWLTRPGEDTKERVCELLLACARDQVHTEDLKVYLRECRKKHVDLVELSYQDATLVEYCNAHKDELPFLEVVQKILAGHTLRVFMLNASKDSTQFEAFKNYFDAHQCDIDAIMLLPQGCNQKSLGEYYFSRDSGDKAYMDVLQYVDRYRMKSPLEKMKKQVADGLKYLVDNVVKGRVDISELDRYTREHRVNIDEIKWDRRYTIGGFLDTGHAGAAILALPHINNHRTLKKSDEEIVRLLTYDVLYHQKSFDVWKSRYKRTPFNADQFIIDRTKKVTLGQFLDQVSASSFFMGVAQVVQEHRSDKSAFLRGLLKRYESGSNELASIKQWLRMFPQMLTTLYDASQPTQGTCADYIQHLNKPELLPQIQQVLPQVDMQPKGKSQTWDVVRAGSIGVVLVALAYYVLSRWSYKKTQKENAHQEQQMVAVQ